MHMNTTFVIFAGSLGFVFWGQQGLAVGVAISTGILFIGELF